MSERSFVNLNETGALTQSGRNYQADSQDSDAHAQSFRGRMEASRNGLKGRSGLQFQGMTDTHGNNLRLLGAQFADQAFRAVRGEQAIVSGEEESITTQQATVSTVEGQVSTLSRQINV